MPVVIILFLIFLVLIGHIAYLKLRNQQLEKKARKNSYLDSHQDDDQ